MSDERVVVSDDNQTIVVTAYRDDTELSAVTLFPIEALVLAQALLDSALRHLYRNPATRRHFLRDRRTRPVSRVR
jgi:hypothetical protein